MYILSFDAYELDFSFEAGTSRGVMKQRNGWFLSFGSSSSKIYGRGEVAPLRGLSQEDIYLIPAKLSEIAEKFAKETFTIEVGNYRETARSLAGDFASVRFGLEMAFLDFLHGGRQRWFDNAFTRKEKAIPINGLIWMGDADFMKKQVYEKLDAGFECIKLKIGSLDFETELEILKLVKSLSTEVILRVDANGAFHVSEVFSKLAALAKIGLHSIEQPILPRQPEAMALLCQKSPVPIALDEELIGIDDWSLKKQLIEDLKPQALVLKPSLLGGFEATTEWIDLANENGNEWWVTSALESNVGLNAIAQYCGNFDNPLHQGLGTGSLFTNNTPAGTKVEQGKLYFVS